MIPVPSVPASVISLSSHAKVHPELVSIVMSIVPLSSLDLMSLQDRASLGVWREGHSSGEGKEEDGDAKSETAVHPRRPSVMWAWLDEGWRRWVER